MVALKIWDPGDARTRGAYTGYKGLGGFQSNIFELRVVGKGACPQKEATRQIIGQRRGIHSPCCLGSQTNHLLLRTHTWKSECFVAKQKLRVARRRIEVFESSVVSGDGSNLLGRVNIAKMS